MKRYLITEESSALVADKVNKPPTKMATNILLASGILSSLLYVIMNIVTPMLYKGYSPISQTVSELSAIGAPSRVEWIVLGMIYSLLLSGFGIGIWASAAGNQKFRLVGILFFAFGIVDMFWPPMHQRTALAAGQGSITDTMHIIFSFMWVVFVFVVVAVGSTAFGRSFRIYSLLTLLMVLFFGVLTGIQAPRIQANLDTPWIGVYERIDIGIFLLWVSTFSVILLRHNKTSPRI
jgi:hypothetical protein